MKSKHYNKTAYQQTSYVIDKVTKSLVNIFSDSRGLGRVLKLSTTHHEVAAVLK